MLSNKLTINLLKLFAVLGIIFLTSSPVRAQSDEIDWSPPINISKSPEKASVEPFILADPAGYAHLFWGEKTLDVIGNQPDTMMYSVWNGQYWTVPIDIFSAPAAGNPQIHFPTAVIDGQGIIHLIWIMQPNFPNFSLYYSSAPATEASSALAWKEPVVLASDLTGTNYSYDIELGAEQDIHIVYSRGAQGEVLNEERAVSYIYSADRGTSWASPVDLHYFRNLERGASNNRLVFEPPNNLYTSFSEWGSDGNGKILHFIRSLDNGESWEEFVILTEAIPGEYERDWNNLTVSGEGQLIAMWEEDSVLTDMLSIPMIMEQHGVIPSILFPG